MTANEQRKLEELARRLEATGKMIPVDAKAEARKVAAELRRLAWP